MSKSVGNVVDPVILISKYGLDPIRYFLLREVPFGSDGVFSNEALIQRINSDLANDLGNLLNRTVAMIDKYFGGTIPEQREEGEFDSDLRNTFAKLPHKVEELMDRFQFSSALTEIWKAISRTNKYIDETMPWVLAKSEENKPRLAAVMYNLAESLRIVSILIQPFMPETPPEMWEQLGISDNSTLTWDSARQWGGYPAGTTVRKGEALFPRIDIKKELEELEAISAKGMEKNENGGHSHGAAKDGQHTHGEQEAPKGGREASDSGQADGCRPAGTPYADKTSNEGRTSNEAETSRTAGNPNTAGADKADDKSAVGGSGLITIEDFTKLDLRVAKVLEAERIEGSDKLLKLKLELGSETRQVVAGIAKYYAPEDLIGKSVIVVANLKPARLRGVESQGMILAASGNGNLAIVTVDGAMDSGAKVT
jgi:methionyl-tRNA synthetase